MKDEKGWFDFGESFESIEWLEQLPKNFLARKVDLEHYIVTITNEEEAHQIYVGPKDLDKGGDALIVTLDENYLLKDYLIERLPTMPSEN